MIADVPKYFIAKLNALGLTEWSDGFGLDNVPSTVLDNCYQWSLGTTFQENKSQAEITLIVPFNLVVRLKAYREVKDKMYDGMDTAESIIASLVNIEDQIQFGIKGVVLNSFDLRPFQDDTNDNVVELAFTYEARIHVCID